MAKSTKKTPKLLPPHEVLAAKATAFMADEQALLKKHGLKKRIIVTFPHTTKVPLFGHIAIWLLKRSKGIIDTEFAIAAKK